MADIPRAAIVTGSESGIGRATAVALAEQGCDLGITWYRSRADAEATAEEVRSLGRRAEVRHLELTRLPGAADVVDELAPCRGPPRACERWGAGGVFSCSAPPGAWWPPAAVGAS